MGGVATGVEGSSPRHASMSSARRARCGRHGLARACCHGSVVERTLTDPGGKRAGAAARDDAGESEVEALKEMLEEREKQLLALSHKLEARPWPSNRVEPLTASRAALTQSTRALTVCTGSYRRCVRPWRRCTTTRAASMRATRAQRRNRAIVLKPPKDSRGDARDAC